MSILKRSTRAAALLHYARRQTGLSQRQVALRAGVPQSAVARVERGRIVPRLDTLERLLRACGFELDLQPLAGLGINLMPIRALLRLSPAERARIAVEEARNLAKIPTARMR